MVESLRHIIKAQQFSRNFLEELFPLADEMENVAQKGGINLLNRRIVYHLFYEPSTRTRVSFEDVTLLN